MDSHFSLSKLGWILVSLPFAVSGFAQSNQKSAAVKAPDCFFCQFPISPEKEKAQRDPVCEDLFEASCRDKDGKQKFKEFGKALTADLVKKTTTAREAAVKTLGYKDYDEALRSRLTAAGLSIERQPEPTEWHELRFDSNEDSEKSKSDSTTFTAIKECEKEKKALGNLNPSLWNYTKDLREKKKKFEDFQQKYREWSIRLYAQDMRA